MKIVAGHTNYSIYFCLMKYHSYAQHYHQYYLVLEWSVAMHSDLNGFLMICSNLISLFHILKWTGLRNQWLLINLWETQNINCISKSIHTVYGGQCWSQYQSSRWIKDISCNRDYSDINSLFRKFCYKRIG